jgi:hypothetical protein
VRKARRARGAKRRARLVTVGKRRFRIPQRKRRNYLVRVRVRPKHVAYFHRTRRRRVLASGRARFYDNSVVRAKRRFFLYRPSGVKRGRR